MVIKKCNWCERTTDANKEDLHEINWSGFQIQNNKIVYACPNHKLELKKEVTKQVRNLSKKQNE